MCHVTNIYFGVLQTLSDVSLLLPPSPISTSFQQELNYYKLRPTTPKKQDKMKQVRTLKSITFQICTKNFSRPHVSKSFETT